MANGAAARLFPEPLSAPPAGPAPDKPIEVEIGRAVADAATMLCRAVFDYQANGQMAPATKEAGAMRIARVAMLQLDHEPGDDDFLKIARNAGSQVLRRYLTGSSPAAADAVVNMALDSVFEITTRVVKTERIYRAAWAN